MAAADAPLRIEHTPDAIVLTGEIDAHTAAAARAALITVEGCGDVRLDVSAVSFIDSSGLRVLLEAHQALQHEQRRLVLLQPSTPVARLIEVTGLVPLLHVEPPIDPVDPIQQVGVDR